MVFEAGSRLLPIPIASCPLGVCCSPLKSTLVYSHRKAHQSLPHEETEPCTLKTGKDLKRANLPSSPRWSQGH